MKKIASISNYLVLPRFEHFAAPVLLTPVNVLGEVTVRNDGADESCLAVFNGVQEGAVVSRAL